MSDLIDRDLLIKSIDYICSPGGIWAKPFEGYKEAFKEFVKGMPSAEYDDWMEKNKDLILQAGMEGREVEFRMEGRLFAIREKAQ